MAKIFIVIAEFKGMIEKVIPCADKETADNYALDCIEKNLEVATYEEEIKTMEDYNG